MLGGDGIQKARARTNPMETVLPRPGSLFSKALNIMSELEKAAFPFHSTTWNFEGLSLTIKTVRGLCRRRPDPILVPRSDTTGDLVRGGR